LISFDRNIWIPFRQSYCCSVAQMSMAEYGTVQATNRRNCYPGSKLSTTDSDGFGARARLGSRTCLCSFFAGLKALVLQQRLQSPSLLQRRLHSTLLTPSHVLCLVAKRKQSRYCITRQAIILGEGGTALLLSELSMGTPSREDP